MSFLRELARHQTLVLGCWLQIWDTALPLPWDPLHQPTSFTTVISLIIQNDFSPGLVLTWRYCGTIRQMVLNLQTFLRS